jgi:hypothetical protein
MFGFVRCHVTGCKVPISSSLASKETLLRSQRALLERSKEPNHKKEPCKKTFKFAHFFLRYTWCPTQI